MARKSTKAKILDAAEKLFAEKGYDGTSVRAICNTARVNVAAVHYHFNGKVGVVEAIFERRMIGLSARRKKLLDDLFSQNDIPDVRSLIETLVQPLAELIDSAGSSGQAYVAMLARFFHERPDLLWTAFMKHNQENMARQAKDMVKALPHIPEEVLGRRQTIGMAAALHWLANPVHFTREGPQEAHKAIAEESVSELIDFLAGGLSAPLTQAESSLIKSSE